MPPNIFSSREFLIVGKMPFLESVRQNFISCPPFREAIKPIKQVPGNKPEVFRQFVESIRQNLRDKWVVVRHVIEPIRQDAGSKLVVFREFVESTRQGLGNKARQLVGSIRGSIRQGLEDNILVFNYTLLLQAIVGSLGAILSGVLFNLTSNRLWDMEQKNVSGFIILVRYLPMSFVHYYCLTIPTVILWIVQYKLFMKLKVIGHLPVVARPLDSQVTRPGSHPLDAQRLDSPITGPPHPPLTGPIDPQATAPSDPQGTGPLDLHLKMLVCVLEHCGSPAPAMSVNSAIESARWARTGPELLALTLCFKNLAEDVEEAYQSLVAQSLVALPTGSKVIYRTFEFGPQTQDSEFEELRKLVLKTMSTARILDPDCTLQLGSFAVWKNTDSGLRWWRLEKSWTPTISEVRQSPWNLLYTLSGFPRLWIVRGSNLRKATLKASTEDEIETLHVLQHKVESNEDVLLCEEPRLIQASAIREKVYICASHSVEVQDGVTFGLQSEPINANKSSWILAMGRFIPSRWTMTMFLSLSLLLLGGVSYGIHFFIWHLVDLQRADITGLGATLQRSSIPSYIFLLLHVLFYGVLFSYSRIFVQPSRVIVDGIPQAGRTRNLEETTSIPSPVGTPLLGFKQQARDLNLSDSSRQHKNARDAQISLISSSRAAPSIEDHPWEDIGDSSTPTIVAPDENLTETCFHSQEGDNSCMSTPSSEDKLRENVTRTSTPKVPPPDEILTETSLHAHEGDEVHSPQTTSPSQEFGDAPGNSPSSTRTKSEGASGSGDLPEHGISTPRLRTLGDVTRMSFVKPVSPNASSDSYWEKKLPPSYADILAQAKDAPPSTCSNKEIYDFLCNGVLLQNGTQEYRLYKGGICQSIGARGLSITRGNNAADCDWDHRGQGSRFREVAYLNHVWRLEARGRLLCSLFPGRYTLSWRLYAQCHIDPIKFSLEVTGNAPVKIQCSLNASSATVSTYQSARAQQLGWRWDPSFEWMEVDVGEFSVESMDSQAEVKFFMFVLDSDVTKSGLYLDGVVIRPSFLIPENQSVNSLKRTTPSREFGGAPVKPISQLSNADESKKVTFLNEMFLPKEDDMVTVKQEEEDVREVEAPPTASFGPGFPYETPHYTPRQVWESLLGLIFVTTTLPTLHRSSSEAAYLPWTASSSEETRGDQKHRVEGPNLLYRMR